MPDIVKQPSAPSELATVPATPESILQQAIAAKMDPTSMEKLYDLFRQMKADAARAAFSQAMSRFKSTCPAIPRRTPNPQFKAVDRNGVSRVRMFASLEDIGHTVRAPLAECGLSYRWGDAKIDAGVLTVPCIISHEGGHSESSSVPIVTESKAGCSDQQKFGIAQTYAMRYSLIAALGLTTCDEDDDGNMPADAGETITEEQAANLELAVQGVGGDVKRFLKMLGVEKFTLIPLSKYGPALAAVDKKRREAK